MELKASWTEGASKRSLYYGGIRPQMKESQTKQQSQMLSFGTRQLAALIHLFYHALTNHILLLGYLFVLCWLQFLLP